MGCARAPPDARREGTPAMPRPIGVPLPPSVGSVRTLLYDDPAAVALQSRPAPDDTPMGPLSS